jgi:hypothetical protein
MNWNKAVSKVHRTEFAWDKVAPGWSTREEVAAQLGCAPENVRSKLAVGLRLGRFEAKTFKIWDPGQERFVFREGYRILTEGAAAAPGPRKARPVTVGAAVVSRTGTPGKITAIKADRITIAWKNGRESTTKPAAFRKADVRVVQ